MASAGRNFQRPESRRRSPEDVWEVLTCAEAVREVKAGFPGPPVRAGASLPSGEWGRVSRPPRVRRTPRPSWGPDRTRLP